MDGKDTIISQRSSLTPISRKGQGELAREEALPSDLSMLQQTLTDMDIIDRELNFVNPGRSDFVTICSALHTLLLEHQREVHFKEALKSETQRARVELSNAHKEKIRLENRLNAKERENGALAAKASAGDVSRKEETSRARREADDLQRRLLSTERKLIQMQHEIKRKEKESERLKERLGHYLVDKRKSDSSALDLAGLPFMKDSGAPSLHPLRHENADEGLRAIIMAFESREKELKRENAELRSTVATIQEKNDSSRPSMSTCDLGSGLDYAIDCTFPKEPFQMGAEELMTELSLRLKKLQQRMNNLAWHQTLRDGELSVPEQRMKEDLEIAKSVVRDQETLIIQFITPLKSMYDHSAEKMREEIDTLSLEYEKRLAVAQEQLASSRQATAALETEADNKTAHLSEEVRKAEFRAQAAEEAVDRLTKEKVIAADEISSSYEAKFASLKNEKEMELKRTVSRLKEEHLKLQNALKEESCALNAEILALRARLQSQRTNYEDLLSKKESKVSSLENELETLKRDLLEARSNSMALSEQLSNLTRDSQSKEERLRCHISTLEERMESMEIQPKNTLQLAKTDESAVDLNQHYDAVLTNLKDVHQSEIDALNKKLLDLQRDQVKATENQVDLGANADENIRHQIHELTKELDKSKEELLSTMLRFYRREEILVNCLESERRAKVLSVRREIEDTSMKKLNSIKEDFCVNRAQLEGRIKELEESAEEAQKKTMQAENMYKVYGEKVKRYQKEMQAWAPGLGAGLFLEKAVGNRVDASFDAEPVSYRQNFPAQKGKSSLTMNI